MKRHVAGSRYIKVKEMVEKYKKYEPIFGAWYLNRLIGRGSFGEVYEIHREEYGTAYRAALKIISVPQDEDDIKTRMTEGTDIDTISEYYEEVLKEIVKENEIMSKLKGNSNIVSYEDHQIIPHEDGIGYDILIRMELLAPLLDRMLQRKLEEKDVVRLGIDICKALELCHERNIIHRDIKPQNIFISESGDYKLGDFGIARTIEKTTGGMSKKGTYKYMAPEVYRGEEYDSRADIYSLGLVLYSLLNDNRGPFLPPAPEKITPQIEEDARNKRFLGEKLTAPKSARPMLWHIIEKACKPNCNERYKEASEMRDDLELYLANYGSQSAAIKTEHSDEKTEIDNLQKRDYLQQRMQVQATRDIEKKNKPSWGFILIGILALIIITTAIIIAKCEKSEEISKAELNTEQIVNNDTKTEESINGDSDNEAINTRPTEEEAKDAKSSIEKDPENTKPYSAVASSALSAENNNDISCEPENVMDGDYKTAWVEGADGRGLGETITVSFNNKYPIEAICIANGYQKSSEVYVDNNRIKDLEIEFADGSKEQCELLDYDNGEQVIILSQPRDSNSVKLRIISVYPGKSDDRDTCITEISLMDPSKITENSKPIVHATSIQ